MGISVWRATLSIFVSNVSMAVYPKITLVTPCYNQAPWLEQTILSVISQGYPNLEYIIIDGGSTDGSVEIIQKYASHFAYWVSEPDQGQYDAIQKGFSQGTGEIMAWLNSDDLYYPNSLFAVARLFQQFPEVEWLMGFPTEYTPEGFPIHRISLPWARWSKYRYYTYDFQFIEQESTFWRRSLWEKAGGYISREFSLAADMELWARFFRHTNLYTTLAVLGGFRHRNGDQRSKDHRQDYLSQCEAVIRRERKNFSFSRRIGFSLLRMVAFPLGIFFFFDVPFLAYLYEWLMRLPPVIHYDFEELSFKKGTTLVKHPPLYMMGKQIHRKSWKNAPNPRS